MKNSSPTVTIDDLAIMIKKGFDDVGRQFRELFQHFDRLESRFNAFEEKFQDLSDVKFKDHGVRIRRIERKLEIVH